MTYHQPLSTHPTIPLILTQAARARALGIAHQYADLHAAEQAYRDTLAVYAVHNYLKILGIDSDLGLDDRYNPIAQFTNDPAALEIPGKGKLECLSITSRDSDCLIPPEAQIDRIGYVVVQLDDDQAAEILGFAAIGEVQGELLSLNRLQDLSQLPYFLSEFIPTANLRQWLEDLYQQDWHSPEELLTRTQLTLVRKIDAPTEFYQAKLLKWPGSSGFRPVAMCVAVKPEDEYLTVHIQLHPVTNHQRFPEKVRFAYTSSEVLPPHLTLTLLSDSGESLREVISRVEPLDDCIQLPKIRGAAGEQFSIEVSLEGHHIKQHFIT